MTTADYLATIVLPSALQLLPADMDTPEARAMLLSVAYQESGCVYRRQLNGPARGFWQFEVDGMRGILAHPLSKPHMADALAVLGYPVTTDATVPYLAVEDNDILATLCARLLLWTDPESMPSRDETDKGWTIYERCWRPGKPRRSDWPANCAKAWEVTHGVLSAIPKAAVDV